MWCICIHSYDLSSLFFFFPILLCESPSPYYVFGCACARVRGVCVYIRVYTRVCHSRFVFENQLKVDRRTVINNTRRPSADRNILNASYPFFFSTIECVYFILFYFLMLASHVPKYRSRNRRYVFRSPLL